LDNPIRIDDEPASRFHSGILIINTVNLPHSPAGVGEHGKRNATIYHFGEFMVIPHLVHKHTVYTHGKDFYTKLLKIGVLFSNC
jgi:hypothetical protein